MNQWFGERLRYYAISDQGAYCTINEYVRSTSLLRMHAGADLFKRGSDLVL